MDCSLATWPSFPQFDDLTWMGLGEIDPLESLDRSFDNGSQFTETSPANPEKAKPSSPASKAPCSAELLHTKSDDFYKLTSAESLAAARWESINAVDLASVLDTFPSNNDSTPGEQDVYDLYSESMEMQADPPLSGDVDMFMSDSMSELADANNTVAICDDKSSLNGATVICSDHTSFSSTQEDAKCEVSVVDDGSPASVNVSGSLCGTLSQKDVENGGLGRVDCNLRHLNHVENRCGGSRVNAVQPSGRFALNSTKLLRCANPGSSGQGALNFKEPTAPQQRDCVQPGLMMQWSKPHSASATTQLYDREQVVQHNPMQIGDNYPAILDQQVRLADAARVTSELKRNRAQASRARRLAASQRRAKKYPLQKLIRMSSSSANTREKLDLNISGASVIPHPPSQLVSQSHVNTSPNSQLPTFLPVALQGPGSHLTSSRELLSHSNGMQCSPYYQYQYPSIALHEEKLISPSGSCSLQPKHNDQDVQSISAIRSLAASDTINSTQYLDVLLLNQLQSIVSKMNVDMRLCIRDALYRLARSAKYRQSRGDCVSGSEADASHLEAMETNTNSIDRWIVNMLFCKQPAPFQGF
ncbi:hypothetical protein L7F22_055542 [Adiantum nelumboides]|nr:hypothetical protein [Adiantum nelumboides]